MSGCFGSGEGDGPAIFVGWWREMGIDKYKDMNRTR